MRAINSSPSSLQEGLESVKPSSVNIFKRKSDVTLALDDREPVAAHRCLTVFNHGALDQKQAINSIPIKPLGRF